MSLRNDAAFKFGPSFIKLIPKNSDGSTPLPYPGKTEVAAFSSVGTFDFSGASVIAAVPLSIKINTVAETKTIDLSAAADDSAVTVAELVAAITAASFTGVTAEVDSRGYGKISATGKDGEVDYIQVYGEAAILAEFGFGFGLYFRYIDTMKTFAFTPVNVDDEKIETIDANNKKTYVLTPGYRDGLTAALTDSAVDDETRAMLTGGSYDTVNSIFVDPTADSEKPLISVEVVNKMYLKNSNQSGDDFGSKVTRAFNLTAKEDSTGDGARAFQDCGFSFSGTDYKDPADSTVIIGASSTQDYTKAAFAVLDYESI